jgi:hypothetical protein
LPTGFLSCYCREREEALWLAHEQFQAAPAIWEIGNVDRLMKEIPVTLGKWCARAARAGREGVSVKSLGSYADFLKHPQAPMKIREGEKERWIRIPWPPLQ